MLEVRELVCGYRGGQPVIGPLSFRLERGEVLCLLGPNGAGKTTLLKTILGLLRPLGGAVLLDGRDAGTYSVRAFARRAAYVPQAHVPPFPYTVRDVVVMGRSPHLNEFASPGEKDLRAAERALAELGIAHLADRDYTRLSGGERQMVLIARALAQEAELLVLDEPTAHLDYGNEARVMEQVKGLSRKGYAVLLVTHGPGQALLWADQAAAAGPEGFFAAGRPEAVLTEETLSRLYGADVELAEVTLRNGQKVKTCICLARKQNS